MKKYKVSLALKIPSNFEIEIDANSEKEALEKSIEEFSYRDSDEANIMDADWENIELDIKTKGNICDIGNGIFIEEVKEKI